MIIQIELELFDKMGKLKNGFKLKMAFAKT